MELLHPNRPGCRLASPTCRDPLRIVRDNDQSECPAKLALYQPAVILTYEDGLWWFSARSARSRDVVHRDEGATQSEGHHKPPAGLSFPLAGQRQSVATMNHIAASALPCQQTGMTILIGQDHRRLV